MKTKIVSFFLCVTACGSGSQNWSSPPTSAAGANRPLAQVATTLGHPCETTDDCGALVCASVGSGSLCEAPCEGDSDCQSNLICANGGCTFPIDCVSDADCESGNVCQGNACSSTPSCASDADCWDGRICNGGSCQQAECQTDSDCLATGCYGQICAGKLRNTSCIFKLPYYCVADESCGCNGGRCSLAPTDVTAYTGCVEVNGTF